MTCKRRIANRVAAWLRSIMPENRSEWSLGIACEIQHIEQDDAALRWAVGALAAACLERATLVCSARLVRIPLTLSILFQALGAIFAPCLLLAWRGDHLRLAALLGSRTPGDDYHRFVPLLAILPTWYVTLGFIAGLLLLLSAAQLLRHSPSALPIFLAGLAFEVLGEAHVRLVPGYLQTAHQVFSFPGTNLRRDVLIPVATNLLPVVVAILLWILRRRDASQPPAARRTLLTAD